MRIVRFISGTKTCVGQDIDGKSARRIEGDLFSDWHVTDGCPQDRQVARSPRADRHPLHRPELPRARRRERLGDPGQPDALHQRPATRSTTPFDPIPIPRRSSMIDYEAELCVVIGKAAKNVSRESALDYVFGYTVANDVSARDWQREKSLGGGQFARGKSFDGFCPLGPVDRHEGRNPQSQRPEASKRSSTAKPCRTTQRPT